MFNAHRTLTTYPVPCKALLSGSLRKKDVFLADICLKTICSSHTGSGGRAFVHALTASSQLTIVPMPPPPIRSNYPRVPQTSERRTGKYNPPSTPQNIPVRAYAGHTHGDLDHTNRQRHRCVQELQNTSKVTEDARPCSVHRLNSYADCRDSTCARGVNG
ncbi:hypothetical protein K458DRAFT_200330 [Lentithecium fluviatile CBS 122367]|uniref:Uncharacterized protein n=1 Tax=Lentithecium fluviatile CBS 122367 TaxID=1168545 RepID=A0A6G1J8V7_9PLEO|nr:hypothetical protein K458DRAFT_200330 [Lentithecium fluviatile CBS 122367]